MRAALGTDLALSGVYGVAEPTALAFSFGFHLGGFFPITIIGLYYAWRLGVLAEMGGDGNQRELGLYRPFTARSAIYSGLSRVTSCR